MKKILLWTIPFFIMLCAVICIGLHVDSRQGKMVFEETQEGKELVIYDRQNHKTEKIPVTEKTYIKQLTDDLYEIVQSVGSPARYVFYYDMKNGKISEVFFNPILVSADNASDWYIAYMEDGALVICDIFDKEGFCKRIVRDFTKTADPISVIISITPNEDGQFVLKYYQGEAYNVVTETV